MKMNAMKKKIHISIDDKINIFEDLNANQNYYDSIFANRTLNLLKILHDNYNMIFHLYCFCENMNASFKLKLCTDKFRKEFKKNKNWLKINFHGKNGNANLDDINISEFRNLFCNFKKQIKRICGLNLSHSTRLHNYTASSEQLAFLAKSKVDKLFVSESDNIESYKLTKTKMNIVKKKGYYYSSEYRMQFVNVHIRLDNCNNVLKEMEKVNNNSIYIYMHEWMFFDDFDKMKSDLISIGEWRKERKYRFI